MSSPNGGGSRLGARFGPYELRSLIGAGGAGEVYRAYDTRADRVVALKLMPAGVPAMRERFWRDLAIATRLHEPHIVPVHDFGEIDGTLFVDMGLIDRGSLKDLLREEGALEAKPATAIIAQVAAALDAAHAGGLVHGDVRPANVLFTDDLFTYLVDFGVAPRGGSNAYTAPEGFGGGRVGPAADVYALACVLYECLTGRPPYDGADPDELRESHMFAPQPRPSIMRRGVDRQFDDVIARGMAKQPAARYASAGDLARAAAEAAAALVHVAPPRAQALPVSPPSSERPAASRTSNRARLVLAGAAVVVLFAAVVVAATSVFAGHRSSTPPQAAKAAPPAPPAPSTTKAPSLSEPVQGADALGFVGQPARCDPGDPPAAVVRTAESLAVVCQTGSGSFYYRGERLRDGAHIEVTNVVRSSDGFIATNPSNGVRYEVRPERLRILSGSHVDSSEPVLQYATAT